METPATETDYFLVIDGQKYGPFQLAALIDAGMEHDTLVWWGGSASWRQAGNIPKLAALLKAERRRRVAARRAERLPAPGPIRQLGRASLLANVPAAAMFIASSTLLLTSLVLGTIAANSVGPPPAQANEGLLRAARWLLVVGVCGSVLGLPLFLLEAVFIGRLVWRCRTVVRTAAVSYRDDGASLNLADLEDLAHTDLGGPALPTFDYEDLLLLFRAGAMPGGMAGLHLLAALVLGTLFLMGAPTILCLSRPQMAAQVKTLVVLLAIYAAVHLPLVIAMLCTVYRTGYGLNAVIDVYRLKVPWAPIALGFWTALCGGLLMTGPFSLVFFVLLAIWARRTSESAAGICDPISRELIAVPLATKLSGEPAPRDPGSWSEASRRS